MKKILFVRLALGLLGTAIVFLLFIIPSSECKVPGCTEEFLFRYGLFLGGIFILCLASSPWEAKDDFENGQAIRN